MKTSILSSSLKAALVLATVATAAGTVPAARAQQIGMDPILEWCNDSITVLNYQEQQARMVYSMGRVKEAKNLLLAGLNQASGQHPGWGTRGPVTMLAITRVKQIAQSIDAAIADDLLGDRTSAVYLFRGYQFIRQVARDLDVQYYVPYWHGGYSQRCRGGCNDFNLEAFESAFVRYAGEQLDMVMDSLVVGGPQGSTPLGAPKAILKGLQVAAAASAYDLRNSLWAAHFACEISQLNGLSAKLASYLSGDRTLYRNDPDAFYATTAEGRYLSNMIANGLGCARFSGAYDNMYDGFNPNAPVYGPGYGYPSNSKKPARRHRRY